MYQAKLHWYEIKNDCTLEINPDADLQEVVVNIGSVAVLVDKLYGPLAAELVRVRLDADAAEWVVERQRVDNNTWEEKLRWYCQESWPAEDEKAAS